MNKMKIFKCIQSLVLDSESSREPQPQPQHSNSFRNSQRWDFPVSRFFLHSLPEPREVPEIPLRVSRTRIRSCTAPGRCCFGHLGCHPSPGLSPGPSGGSVWHIQV